MRSDTNPSTNANATRSKLWARPDLVCFGSVQNLTAGGTAGFSETFTNDGGFTTLIPLPNFRA